MRGALILAGIAACYSPHESVRCSVQCDFASDEACPEGLECRADNFCYGTAEDQLCGDTVELTIETTGQGAVAGADGSHCSGTCTLTVLKATTLEITATPDADALLASWSLDGQMLDLCDGVACGTVVALDADHRLNVAFDTAHNLSVTFIGDGAGDVALSGGDLSFVCSSSEGSCERRFPPNTPVQLSSTALVPSVFAGFGNCMGSSGSGCSLVLDTDVAVSAAFDAAIVTVLGVPDAQGTITITEDEGQGVAVQTTCPPDCTKVLPPVAPGRALSLVASAVADHEFVGWFGCPSPPPPGNPRCNSTFPNDTFLVALFQPEPILEIDLLGVTGDVGVFVGGSLVSCPHNMSCSYRKPTGTVFALSAGNGSPLMSWGNPVCPDPPTATCSFPLDHSLTFSPRFGP